MKKLLVALALSLMVSTPVLADITVVNNTAYSMLIYACNNGQRYTLPPNLSYPSSHTFTQRELVSACNNPQTDNLIYLQLSKGEFVIANLSISNHYEGYSMSGFVTEDPRITYNTAGEKININYQEEARQQ